uniref:precorrin-2 dehydrogenase/sirohydrochlorin ferrochelatase family protein n=1 Tax=Altererythrobacter segetis TaxID=1104773 RepID=UPI00140A84EB|nr:bifunctional precorrin-2 dehydrogenase/sirohydrochlorin ferrochelatase [Altererythrobacter segetis]
MKSLPLFHRIAGQPVIVLGEGPAADAKRRLVERAGGVAVGDLQVGIERGARLAFVAVDDEGEAEAAVVRLHRAGVLVNVADRPALCDFITPSVLDRDPVQIAVGTDGTSAGLAKHLRLRLEALLPDSLGLLAQSLAKARDALRERWPDAAERRRALDAALTQGGPLDPFLEHGSTAVPNWLREGQRAGAEPTRVELVIDTPTPDGLTLRQLQLLGAADAILYEPGVPPAILDRARADAARMSLPHEGPLPGGLILVLRRG